MAKLIALKSFVDKVTGAVISKGALFEAPAARASLLIRSGAAAPEAEAGWPIPLPGGDCGGEA